MAVLGDLPVAVIGGGPIGLAAAAHLRERGISAKVYEAGLQIGANVREWGHVRMFTPWRYCVDAVAEQMLGRYGWKRPPAEMSPTGNELVRRYLEPLTATPELNGVVELGARVVSITRQGVDKVVSRDRGSRPLVLSIETARGMRQDLARAVIDASGTWSTPNPLGAGGVPATGEAEEAERIVYGIPDVLGRDRSDYAGYTTLVVGAGHSAANVLLDLAQLADNAQGTSIVWATRGTDLTRVYSSAADQLPARGALGARLKKLVSDGRARLVPGFAVTTVRRLGGRMIVEGTTADGTVNVSPVDRIVVAAGQRPDLSLTRELRLDLDPWLESTRALGPLIDPNLHFCGSVPPHGHRELAHPEPGFYTVGIKSYGRAPTFLLLTGYEQARSVVAAIAGDMDSADDVHLVLPETGVCSTQILTGSDTSGCCGGPAPAESDSCCVSDMVAKFEGKAGCGCGVVA